MGDIYIWGEGGFDGLEGLDAKTSVGLMCKRVEEVATTAQTCQCNRRLYTPLYNYTLIL